MLTHLRDLFALTIVEEHAAWHLEHGRLSGARSQAVTSTIERLLGKLRPHALDLVAAFGLGDEHLRAHIATGAEGERQAEAQAHYDRLRASGELPTPEKKAKGSSPDAQPIAVAGAAPVAPADILGDSVASAASAGSATDAADDEQSAPLAAR